MLTKDDITIRRPTVHNARPQTLIEIPADDEHGTPAVILELTDDRKVGVIIDGAYYEAQKLRVWRRSKGYRDLMSTTQTKVDFSPEDSRPPIALVAKGTKL